MSYFKDVLAHEHDVSCGCKMCLAFEDHWNAIYEREAEIQVILARATAAGWLTLEGIDGALCPDCHHAFEGTPRRFTLGDVRIQWCTDLEWDCTSLTCGGCGKRICFDLTPIQEMDI